MKITIGIPTYDDFEGLQWTIQSLMMFHDTSDLEILVIDNNPIFENNKLSKKTSKLMYYVHGIGGKYVPLPKPIGTAPARNKIFSMASGDIVIVCDSHIILGQNTINNISTYLKKNPLDIVTGPLMKRSIRPDKKGLMIHATHYSDIWHREMWGMWAQAWLCCKKHHFEVRPKTEFVKPTIDIENNIIISAQYYPKPPKCSYHSIQLGNEITHCPECNKEFPDLNYHHHQIALMKHRYTPRGWDSKDIKPFEIPGLGLGMFACLKKTWPGFPPGMVGFGGGELHLHELFRRNGGKAVCLPNAPWWHYFTDDPPPYDPQLWEKVRNYIIWRDYLDLPKDPVYKHFVLDTKRLSDEQWNYLIEDPINRLDKPNHLQEPIIKRQTISGNNCEELYDTAIVADRNFEYYFPIIKKLSSEISDIIAITRRNQWDIAVLAGKPKHYASHCSIIDNIQETLLKSNVSYEFDNVEPKNIIPKDCDILLLDVFGSKKNLDSILNQWAKNVKKWIVIIGTGIYADISEDNIRDDGLYYCIIDFTNNAGWNRVFHSKYGLGLTIISNNPLEKSIDNGVGYNLTKLYTSLKIFPKEDCLCKKRNRLMNELGPDGCLEKFDDLVVDMKKDADKYKWNDKLVAGTSAVLNGLAFQINPFKPIESLLSIAIRKTKE